MKKPTDLVIKDTEGSWADLSRWLIKGGASSDARWFYRDATDETWRGAIDERIPFINAVKDVFNLEVTRGASPASISSYTSEMNVFIKWIDENNLRLTPNEETLEAIFFKYDAYIYFRAWVKKEVKCSSAYQTIFRIAQIFSQILNRASHTQFKHFSKVIKSHKTHRKTSISPAAEKQHLGDSQILGYYCVDIANAIDIKTVCGRLPITVGTLRPDGSTQITELPLGLVNLLNYDQKLKSNRAKGVCSPSNTIEKFRLSLIRIRLLAELVVFVYQTGMNVSQILQIERKGFSYKLQGDSDWLVTSHKGRKQGPVKFTIYRRYRERFKSLIKFVDHFFPENIHLFPLVHSNAKLRGSLNYSQLKSLVEHDGIRWIPPRVTRNSRANFLDRMTGDPELSAEMSQHTQEIFSKNYDRPSQQRAMSALTHFWNKMPFSLINSGCAWEPESTNDKPPNVIPPNCLNESGCLWCKSHRDIYSEDYIWSLATFRKLKLIEVAQPIKREISADLVVFRLTEKLEAFKNLNSQSRLWVEEALLRIEEGVYHPTWKNIINFWEAA